MITVHTHRVRVYYEDTDSGGIVYYANYLRYFERARTEWLRSLGVEQRLFAQEQHLAFVVRECTVRYRRPARLDDEIEVSVGFRDPRSDLRPASLRFTQSAEMGGRVLATATISVGCVDALHGRPAFLPPALMEQIAGRLLDH